jgi:hypothetical protein
VGLPLLLGLFVLELAVVEDAADGRVGVGGDFDEVEAGVAGHGERFVDGRDAQLVALIVDDEDFPDANPFVDAEFSGYTGPLAASRKDVPWIGALL